jgi:glycosyltransferase involved in cell wall biosynthesis
MASKKVLMISYYFPPYGGGGVYRNLSFAKYLPAFMWEPIVIAPKPKKYYWAFDYSLLKEVPEDVQVYRTASVEPFYLFSVLDKLGLSKLKDTVNQYLFIPDDRIGWIPSTLLKAVRILKSQDIKAIYTSSPPHSVHLTGYLLKKLTGKPWVVDFRDQWIFSPLYAPSCKPVDAVNNLLEDRVYRICDRIVHVTYTDRFRISKRYNVPLDKIITIPNGYDEAVFLEQSQRKHSDEFTVSFFGSLYGGREETAENFLKGVELALLEDRRLSEKLKITFHGNIHIHQKWLKHSKMKQIIKVDHFRSHCEAIERMFMSSLLLLILKEKDMNVITAKLYEYMASGKPILALVPEGEAKTILKKSNLGFFADPCDPASIRDTLIYLFKERERGKLVIKPNWHFIKQFERKNLVRKLSSLFDGLLGDGP